MKKFVVLLTFFAILLPFNAFALQPLSQNDMGSITAQSGVTIAIDDVKIFQNIQSISYTDSDGTANPLTGVTDGIPGSLWIGNLSMMVNINAITSMVPATFDTTTGEMLTPAVPHSEGRELLGIGSNAYNAQVTDPVSGANVYVFDGTNDAANTYFLAKPLTIDVGKLAVLSAGAAYNDGVITAGGGTSPYLSTTVAGVRIGLPTMEIAQTRLTFDVRVSYAGALNGGDYTGDNFDNSFGTISIGNNTMAVLDGVIEIAPH